MTFIADTEFKEGDQILIVTDQIIKEAIDEYKANLDKKL